MRMITFAGSFVLLCASASATAPQLELPFPFTVVAVGLDSVTMTPDDAALDALGSRSSVRFRNVALDVSLAVDLDLVRFSVVADGALFAVDGFSNPTPLDEGLTLWSGTVRGDDASTAFFAFSRHGSRGVVRTAGRAVDLVAGPKVGGDWSEIVSRFVRVDPNALARIPAEFCAADRIQAMTTPGVAGPAPAPRVASSGGTIEAQAGFTPIYDLRLALETDYQFYQLFNDLDVARTYAMTLFGAVSDRFREQVGVIFSMPYLGLYTSNNDPWQSQDLGGDCIGALFEFQGQWSFGGGPVAADLYHLLSGANLGCGVAWLDVLCNVEYGFSLSGNLGGDAQFPIAQGNSGNWDFVVMAHELGHNFGSPHTHDYCPTPIDQCAPSGYFGSCQSTQACTGSGTLMSYCHLCSGGLNNMTTYFHPTVVGVMRNRVVNSCLGLFTGLGANHDVGFALTGSNGDPELAVEYDAGSNVLSFAVDQGPSAQGGLLIISANQLLAPFLGGTLVPDPSILVAVATNGGGQVSVGAPLPPALHLPRGGYFYTQSWFDDPTGPNGFAATNGVEFELIIP